MSSELNNKVNKTGVKIDFNNIPVDKEKDPKVLDKQTFSKVHTNRALTSAIEESREELKLKKSIAKWTIRIIIGELIFFALITFAKGLNLLQYTDEFLKVYIVSIIGQVLATFYVMVKYLFDPQRPSTMMIVQDLISQDDEEEGKGLYT